MSGHRLSSRRLSRHPGGCPHRVGTTRGERPPDHDTRMEPMRIARTAALSASLAVLHTASASVAVACDCVGTHYDITPREGSQWVPTNAAPVLGVAGCDLQGCSRGSCTAARDKLSLLGPTGAPVPAELDLRYEPDASCIVTLRPLELLAPETEYSVEFASEWGTVSTPFRTGLGPDTSPPAKPPPPTDIQLAFYQAPTCYVDHCADWRAPLDDPESSGSIVEVEVVRSVLEEPLMLAVVQGDDPDFGGPSEGRVYLGRCSCRSGLALRPGEEVRVRQREVDLAGNASAWSEPVSVVMPLHREEWEFVEEQPTSECGCAHPTGAGGGVLALLALGLHSRRRARGLPYR